QTVSHRESPPSLDLTASDAVWNLASGDSQTALENEPQPQQRSPLRRPSCKLAQRPYIKETTSGSSAYTRPTPAPPHFPRREWFFEPLSMPRAESFSIHWQTIVWWSIHPLLQRGESTDGGQWRSLFVSLPRHRQSRQAHRFRFA